MKIRLGAVGTTSLEAVGTCDCMPFSLLPASPGEHLGLVPVLLSDVLPGLPGIAQALWP